MSQGTVQNAPTTRKGLPSRRGCLLLVMVVLLVIAIPLTIWDALPYATRVLESRNPETAVIERTCHDAVALSLRLAATPQGYAPDAVVPQAVRDSQVVIK